MAVACRPEAGLQASTGGAVQQLVQQLSRMLLRKLRRSMPLPALRQRGDVLQPNCNPPVVATHLLGDKPGAAVEEARAPLCQC